MIRHGIGLAALATFAALVLTGAAQAAEPGAPALKPAATVMGEIVRIGDLVENAGAVADIAIFRAPDLGETGSVPVVRVIDALRGHHLIGLDTRGLSEVAVTRAARAITAKEIEANVLRVLAGRYGLPETVSAACAAAAPARTSAASARKLMLRIMIAAPVIAPARWSAASDRPR